MTDCAVLIVAAGAGDRFGGAIPKQYQELGGLPILRRSVEAFLGHPHIGRIQVVINPAHRSLYDKAVGDLALPEPVTGGPTRRIFPSSQLGAVETSQMVKP